MARATSLGVHAEHEITKTCRLSEHRYKENLAYSSIVRPFDPQQVCVPRNVTLRLTRFAPPFAGFRSRDSHSSPASPAPRASHAKLFRYRMSGQGAAAG